ncbi:MAG: hypothetical protein QW828_01650 [Candidatus Bathyarchaeia archaeon]
MRFGLVFLGVLLLLVSSVVPSAFATTEIAYDNGILGGFGVDWGQGGGQVGVKFQVNPGARLLTIRTAAVGEAPVSFTVHILAADGVTPLATPFPATVTGHVGVFGHAAIFESIDVAGKNIIITGTEFFVIFASAGSPARLYLANSAVRSGRSYEKFNTPINPNVPADYNIMIRVVVEYPNPVGGVLVPVNKLGLLTPYLGLAGLIMAVSAVVVVKRRRD